MKKNQELKVVMREQQKLGFNKARRVMDKCKRPWGIDQNPRVVSYNKIQFKVKYSSSLVRKAIANTLLYNGIYPSAPMLIYYSELSPLSSASPPECNKLNQLGKKSKQTSNSKKGSLVH